VDAYFTKPTPLGALVDRIADLLEARP